MLVFEIVHVAGLFLGLLAVGVTMLRHRGLPKWAGLLVLVGLVGTVAAPGRPMLAIAVALLVVGLGAAAGRMGGFADGEPSGVHASRRKHNSMA